MNIELVSIPAAEEPILRQLFQLYAYDFSEILGADLGDTGKFDLRDLAPYWHDAWRHPFFVRVDGKLAGFVLVHSRSRLSGQAGTYDMAEFFILRKYRRKGVGERAAVEAFRRFPGAWEVRELSTNHAAVAFWRRVVTDIPAVAFEKSSGTTTHGADRSSSSRSERLPVLYSHSESAKPPTRFTVWAV